MDVLGSVSLIELLYFYLPKVLVATLCGGLIGVERKLRNKVAGFKTNILICVGTTLYAATAFFISEELRQLYQNTNNLGAFADPLRLIGHIVGGIGFLGAAAIWNKNNKIEGVTTAGFIWVNCAIGIIIGAGGLALAVILSFGLVIVTRGLDLIEEPFKKSANAVLKIKDRKDEET